MSPILVARGITALWSATIVALGAVLGVESDWGKQIYPDIPKAALANKNNAEQSVIPAFAMPPLEVAYNDMLNRPLFLPTRQPTPAVTAVAVQAMRRGQFQLAGTVVNADISVAYLREISSGKTLRITRGSDVNGLQLAVVEPMRVVLKQGDESEEIQLKTGASPRVVAPLPAGAPQQQSALAVPPLAGLGNIPGLGLQPGDPAFGPVGGFNANRVQQQQAQPPQAVPAPFQLTGPGYQVGPLPLDLAQTSPQSVVPNPATNNNRRGRIATPTP